jgi:lysophospholipase L1-like esterase
MTNIRYDQDIYVKARRFALLAQRGGVPVAMVSPPAVAVNASSAITGATVSFTDPLFQYLCTVIDTSYSTANWASTGHVDHNAQLAGYRTGGNMDVCFSTDATSLEMLTYATGGKYRLFINDQAVSLATATLASTFGQVFLAVTGMPSGPKDIRLEMDFNCVFGGVKVPNNYSVWRTGAITPRGLIYGDSYVDGGYGDGTNNAMLGLARQVGYRLGIRDWFCSGASGEGYLVLGNQSGKTARGRAAADLVAYAPDYVLLTHGVNDAAQGKSPAAIQAEVTAFATDVMAALPNTIFTACGPWRAPILNTSAAIKDAIKSGFAAHPEYGARLLYVDPFVENWQSTGAGRVGATSGVGNSNIYIGADGGHPLQAGHDYLAKRLADAAIRHIGVLAA